MKLRHGTLLALTAGLLVGLSSCDDSTSEPETSGRNYRQDMRDFVGAISTYARGIDSDFIVIPQNGHELLSASGESGGPPAQAYVTAIDGVGREDLFYGYVSDNVATPQADTDYMNGFMDLAESNSVEVLVTDYCWTESYMDDSYLQSATRGYISFAADHRDLDNIPSYPATPYNVNSADITSLAEASNFFYLLDPSLFSGKTEFLNAVAATNYDLVITDLFYSDTEQYSSSDIASLKSKANGGTRLVIAYMSIGEVEDYRYYWQSGWGPGNPSWIASENPNWPGNYKVRYWESEWQSIIYGNNDSYLKKILDAGFDGVYLDIIDAFEFFENQQ